METTCINAFIVLLEFIFYFFLLFQFLQDRLSDFSETCYGGSLDKKTQNIFQIVSYSILYM